MRMDTEEKMSKKIIFATGNEGKMRKFEKFLEIWDMRFYP